MTVAVTSLFTGRPFEKFILLGDGGLGLVLSDSGGTDYYTHTIIKHDNNRIVIVNRPEIGSSDYDREDIPPARKVHIESRMRVFDALAGQEKLDGGKRTSEYINAALEYLRDVKTYFDKHGTQVIFVEFPEPEVLYNIPITVRIRTAIKQEFPQVLYISRIDSQYPSSDGTHLDGVNALKFTAELWNLLEEL